MGFKCIEHQIIDSSLLLLGTSKLQQPLVLVDHKCQYRSGHLIFEFSHRVMGKDHAIAVNTLISPRFNEVVERREVAEFILRHQFKGNLVLGGGVGLSADNRVCLHVFIPVKSTTLSTEILDKWSAIFECATRTHKLIYTHFFEPRPVKLDATVRVTSLPFKAMPKRNINTKNSMRRICIKDMMEIVIPKPIINID